MSLLENKVHETYNKALRHCTNQEIYDVLFNMVKQEGEKFPTHNTKKKLYYISAEFLLGRLLGNNLLNLGWYDEIKDELAANGIDLNDILELENEPSLGNGGLGRLAACFLDSIATLGLNGDGIGLNYHYGLFQQVFEKNQQHSLPNVWLDGEDWIKKSQHTFEVEFKNYRFRSTLYDIDVFGYNQEKKTRLRLFDLDTVNDEIVEPYSIRFNKQNIPENLTLFLYPDDSDHDGKRLRVFQQYFMVSNAAQLILHEAEEKGSNLYDLADYAVVQINDTHPTLIIPELIRLLIIRGIEFDTATEIVRSMVAFTNHTILSEALEKWPVNDLEDIIPSIMSIIRSLDAIQKNHYPNNPEVNIIDDYGNVHMANLAIHYGFSINGVANLHTEILKNSELKAFNTIYPEKFNNKTNGVTFRRWLMHCNPELADALDKWIGPEWRETYDLTALEEKAMSPEVQAHLRAIKFANKLKLKKHLQEKQNITINEHSIIDIQIKRIHEYKRQQMNALYAIYKYNEIKNGKKPKRPITIIFGGKAAPAYTIAQDIIHLILTLGELIARDPDVSPYLKVVMVENYNVTGAEYLIPAADISEQISLASKEASGTGNMKFMINGALTLTTYDGSNIELSELVGADNVYMFGTRSEEVVELYRNNAYNPQSYYHRETIKPLVDFILSPGMRYLGNEARLYRLHDDMVNKDYFMALLDIEEYIQIKNQVIDAYEDQTEWTKKVIINIAKSGYFSSDRTIEEYNNDIWHLPTDVD